MKSKADRLMDKVKEALKIEQKWKAGIRPRRQTIVGIEAEPKKRKSLTDELVDEECNAGIRPKLRKMQ